MLVIELLRYGQKELHASGVENAETDVQLLLGHCLGKSRTQLYLAADESVPSDIKMKFFKLLCRRKKREPVAYLLGEREFWSLPFKVSSKVLIPRPETEFLMESVLSKFDKKSLEKGTVLDLCCGSGVICVVLALELKKKIIAVDISIDALRIAKENAQRHRVEEYVTFINGDLFSTIVPKRSFSLIVTNPPYIEQDIIPSLEPEVQKHEPSLALDGGVDGLNIISRIILCLPQVLQKGGELFMEIGADQKKGIKEILNHAADLRKQIAEYTFLKDYAGRDRVFYIKMNE